MRPVDAIDQAGHLHSHHDHAEWFVDVASHVTERKDGRLVELREHKVERLVDVVDEARHLHRDPTEWLVDVAFRLSDPRDG